MTFDSLVFFIFLGIVFSTYWILKGKTQWQNALLLASSYVFYGWWDWRFLGLILFTTLSSYGCALAISNCMQRGEKGKASWMNAANIVVNLSILALFKYYNFFADSITEALSGLGIGVSWPVLHLVLPVGISFYTFQSLSYTIDVRKVAVFEGAQFPDSVSPIVIQQPQKVLLDSIAGIFEKHHTECEIIISPLYNQIRINPADLNHLQELFGATHVHDFSGVNKWNTDWHNYFETSHYRTHVAREILSILYEDQ